MGITREEKLLNSIANGVYSGVQPVTREEQYLSYIAGESDAKPENPITRKELYLDKIPQGGSGGGGGSTGGVSKLAQLADRTVTELTAEDLQGATKLGTYAFYECKKLTSVNIPEGVISIGNNAFYDCGSLVSICFPKSVTSLGGGLIWYCSKLRSITMKSTTPPTIQSGAFNQIPSSCVITVPIGCGDAYKSATNWSAYADYIVEGDV